MADIRWLGRAKARVEIKTAQVTAYDAATTYSLTINGKSVTTIAAGSVNATATNLATAWNATTESEFTAVTASAATDTVTLTHKTAGIPFTVTSSVSGGTGTIGAVSTTTASTGPNHVSDVNNWSGGALPSNSDNVYIGGVGSSLLYDLNALSAVTLTSLIFEASFGDNGETCGLPRVNQTGNYTEYLGQYLEVGATTCRVGVGAGRGSSRIKINFGSVQTAFEGVLTSQGAEANIPACLLLGTHASNAFDANAGSYGICFFGSEVSTFTTVRAASAAAVVIGTGGTIATVITSGTTSIDCATGTALNVKGGQCTTTGSGTHAAIDVAANGTLIQRSSGTVTAITVGPGRVDCSLDESARTFTTTTLRPGGSIYDPAQTITYTNAIARGTNVQEIAAN